MTSLPRTIIIGLWGGAVGIAAVLAFFVVALAGSMLRQLTWLHLTELLLIWQPFIAGVVAGVLALIAAGGTIWATRNAAAQQVGAAQRQTEAMRITERHRIASEAFAFLAMMEAAAKAVLDDVGEARKLAANVTPSEQLTVAYTARTRVKKAGFPELRTACVRYGGQQVTPAFLQLDKAIDDFSAKVFLRPEISQGTKMGDPTGIREQLDHIEVLAKSLRDEVGPEMQRCIALLAETQAPDFR